MTDRSLLPLKGSAGSALASVKNSLLLTLSRFDNSSSSWEIRFSTLRKPRTLISLFLASTAFYCFVIGRDRYTSVSEFVIQRAAPPQAVSSTVLAGGVLSPSVLSSLVDGQYLQVYLASPEVKNRIYADPKALEKEYKPSFPDIFSGLPSGSSPPSQLSFFRNQLQVSPQPLSGAVILRTVGFNAKQALTLNKSLIAQSRRFVNEVNQAINADQNLFAQKERELAEKQIKKATQELEIFQEKFGQLSVISEQEAVSSFIASLEGRLVELKVEEASLRRQYQDPNAPEVSYVADQARELEKQISKERRKAVDDGSRDLNSLAIQESGLNADVLFASEALKAARIAADNSRRESQRQQKFVVMLSEPQLSVAPDQNWRWQAFLGSVGIIVVVWGIGGFILAAMKKA